MKSVAPKYSIVQPESTVDVDGVGRITVKLEIVKPEVGRQFYSQNDFAHFGFPSAAKFLEFARQRGIPCTRAGNLRVFAADDITAALSVDARPLAKRAREASIADVEDARRRARARAAGLALVGGSK